MNIAKNFYAFLLQYSDEIRQFGFTSKNIWFQRGIKLGLALIILFASYKIFFSRSTGLPTVYKIGMDATWSPLELYGKEHNVTAFTTELIFAIARNQSIQVELVKSCSQRLNELLEDHLVEGIFTSVIPEGTWEEKYYFSDPYYSFGAILVTAKDSPITSLSMLSNKSLGIKRSSALLYRIPVDPSASIVPYENVSLMLQDLASHETDAALVDQLFSYLYYGAPYKDELKIVTLPLTKEGLRLMGNKERPSQKLIEVFNAGLAALKANGTYAKLLADWDLYNPAPPH